MNERNTFFQTQPVRTPKIASPNSSDFLKKTSCSFEQSNFRNFSNGSSNIEEKSEENEKIMEEEYFSLKKEVSRLKELIQKDREKIDELQLEIDSIPAKKEFREKFISTFEKDEYFNEKQNRKLKKIVHKERLYDDLTNELDELSYITSASSLFQLSEDLKKERKLLQVAKKIVINNNKKIIKTEEKLAKEKMNPVYKAIEEQNLQIEDIENEINNQINKGNDLKREIEQTNILQNIAENEIQDLLVILEKAEYKREKRQRQFFHLVKKQKQELEDFKSLQTRTVIQETNHDSSRRLFAGIFPQKCMSRNVEKAFLKYGEIEFIRLLANNAKPPQYFAQIQYYEHDAAQSALSNLNHHKIGEQYLNIQWASEQPQTPARIPQKKKQQSASIATLNLRPITNRQLHPPQSRLRTINSTKAPKTIKREKNDEMIYGENFFNSLSSSSSK